jgi:hypothetical protein
MGILIPPILDPIVGPECMAACTLVMMVISFFWITWNRHEEPG